MRIPLRWKRPSILPAPKVGKDGFLPGGGGRGGAREPAARPGLRAVNPVDADVVDQGDVVD